MPLLIDTKEPPEKERKNTICFFLIIKIGSAFCLDLNIRNRIDPEIHVRVGLNQYLNLLGSFILISNSQFGFVSYTRIGTRIT